MKKYQFQILRYMHDQFTGEFANLGVIVYSPDERFITCKTTQKYGRLSEFFGEVNGQFILQTLRAITQSINKIAREINECDIVIDRDLHELTNRILPKDDSAIQFTDVKVGRDLDLRHALEGWYDRLIGRYEDEGNSQKRFTDAQAWSKVYKRYFDKYHLTAALQKHHVSTENDTISFEHAWKNGVWNCYQTLSLDLKAEDSIKSKIYKWSGIIRELQQSKEKLHVAFLTTSPREHGELSDFIKDTLSVNDGNLTVELVDEKHADVFAQKVQKAMIKSNLIGESNEEPF